MAVRGTQTSEGTAVAPIRRCCARWEDVHPSARAAALPHQRRAIEIASALGGRALLALDPGLGKTIVSCALLELYCRGGKRALVAVPAGKRKDWMEELKRWTGIKATLCSSRKDDVSTARVVVVSMDSVALCPSVLKGQWEMVVVDESHLLKTADSKRSKALCALAKRARRALFLSGTPQSGKPFEMWTTLDTLSKGLCGAQRWFEMRYCNAFEGPFGWDAKGRDRWLDEELNLMTSSVMIRMKESEVDLRLPPLVVARVDVSVAPEAVAALKERAAERALIEAKPTRTQSEAQYNFHVAQQMTQEMKRMTGMAKVPALLAWLEAHLGKEKILIMTSDVEEPTKPIVEWLKSKRIKHFTFSAKTSAAKKAKAIEAFSRKGDNTFQVGVCGIKSAGTGLNWAPGVSRIILLEFDWSTVVMEQTAKRIHRIGTTDPCFVYVLFAAKTMDDALLRTIEAKASSNASTIDGGETGPRFHKRMRFDYVAA